MTAPMTPADCDLRGYEWMPLFGARLFNSMFEANASDLAFRIAIKLYWEAWQQVPAASLPNDDALLCRLAGLGRDLKTWRKLRADGVMHGFHLCDDDRLYHRLLADEAIKAWKCRQKADEKREADNERLKRWRQQRGGSERNWDRLRGEVFTRDGRKCVRCGSAEDLHCDHILELSDGGTNDPDNLMTLCRSCHSRKTAKAHPKPDEMPDEMHFKEHFKPNEMRSEMPDEMLARVSDQETQVYPVQEERKEVIKKPYFGEEMRARAEEREEIPRSSFDDELDRLRETPLDDEPETFNRKTEEPLPEKFQVHVRRAAKAMAMSIPYGETRSAAAQFDALQAQPQAVGADQTMGLRWQPAEPVRSIEEMRSAALAGCTPEQIAKAERYARRAAA